MSYSKLVKNIFRIVLIVFLLAFSFVLLGFFSLYYFFPPEKVKPLLLEKLKEKLQVNIELGEIRYSFTGGLNLSQLKVYERLAEKNNPLFFSSEEVKIYLEILPLLKKQIVVHSLEIREAKIFLRKSGQFANWEKLPFWQRVSQKDKDIQPESSWQLIDKLPTFILKNFTINFNNQIHEIAFFKIKGDSNITNVRLNVREGLDLDMVIPLGYERQNWPKFKKLYENPMGEGKIRLKNFRSKYFKENLVSLDGQLKFSGKNAGIFISDVALKIERDKFPYKIFIKKGEILFKNSKNFSGQNVFLTVEEKSEIENLSFRYRENLENLKADLNIYLSEIPELKKQNIIGTFQGRFSYSPTHYELEGKLIDFSLSFLGIPFLTKAHLPLKMEKGQLKILETNITLLDQKLAFSFFVEPKKSHWNIQYSLKGEEFNLKEVVEKLQQIQPNLKKVSATEVPSESFLNKISVLGKIELNRLNYGIWQAQGFLGNLTLHNQILELRPIQFSFLQGKFLGSYQINLANWQQEFSLNFENIKPNDFLEKIGKKETRWFATLMGSLKGNMQGKTAQEWQNSLKANLTLESGKGRLIKSDWQIALVSGFLAPLEDRLSALEYEKAQVHVLAQEGKWYIKKAHLSGYDITLDILGYVSWEKEGELNLELRFKESFIRDLANPILLGIEEQRRGEWYYLPFSCQGKIQEKACWQKDW